MKTVTDQMGEQVVVPDMPLRILSLVPSQTELLFDLGLGDRIVGLTRFCIHPAGEVECKMRIGGTKDFDLDKIKLLNPDLIIGNKEENYEAGIASLKEHYPVWMSDIATLDEAYDMMIGVGDLTGKSSEAASLITEIKTGFQQIPNQKSAIRNRVAYFIWRKPYMVAAHGTFIDHILKVISMENVFADQSRYPEVTADEISAKAPDIIFLSSEPYAFSEKHIAEFQALCPRAKIMITDGEMFSWYGSRLRLAPGYFSDLQSEIGSR